MAFQGLCTVSNAGITLDGRAALLLKSPAFPSGRNFKSASNLTREVLAVALAAITSNNQVYCNIPNETAEWSDVSQINLMSGR
jgi:hypothetical protein